MTGFKHGYARPASRDPAYRSWESARARCRNPKNPDYKHYGARGIKFSPEWDRFVDFLRDMGPRPQRTSLDRIDSNGHYEPGNCRWASASTQQVNKRSNRRVAYAGKQLTISQLAEATGHPYQRLHERIIRRGWDVNRAVNEEPRGW